MCAWSSECVIFHLWSRCVDLAVLRVTAVDGHAELAYSPGDSVSAILQTVCLELAADGVPREPYAVVFVALYGPCTTVPPVSSGRPHPPPHRWIGDGALA